MNIRALVTISFKFHKQIHSNRYRLSPIKRVIHANHNICVREEDNENVETLITALYADFQ